MYGIVEIGGHQYRVQAGDLIDVQKLEAEAGKPAEFDKVLFVMDKLVLQLSPVPKLLPRFYVTIVHVK